MKSLDGAYFTIIERISEIPDSLGVEGILNLIVQSYELQASSYFAANLPNMPGHSFYFSSIYSTGWIERYRAQNSSLADPLVRAGFASLLPIDWRDFDRADMRWTAYFTLAAEFGLGRQGLTVPIHGSHGEKAILTVTNDVSDVEWDRTLRAFQRDFQALAYHIHHAVLRTTVVEQEEVRLSPREMECLKWVAQGKTVAETAAILSISDRTVRFYLDLARAKLKASNITHAVAKALKMNLFTGFYG